MSARLRALHDTGLRGHRPESPPVGAVIEQDGPLIRTHYGTHGGIDYRNLPATGLDTLIRRQRDAFAARGERGDWKVYAHDAPADLPGRLRAAGFVPGWERALLVASLDQVAVVSPAELREVHEAADLQRVALLAAGAGPQRTAFTDYRTDGRLMSWDAMVLAPVSGASIDATAWARHIPGTDFVVIEGMVDPDLTLAPYLSGYDWRRRGCPGWIRRPDARHLLVEADGPRRAALERAGFQPITTATTYHWTPPSVGAHRVCLRCRASGTGGSRSDRPARCGSATWRAPRRNGVDRRWSRSSPERRDHARNPATRPNAALSRRRPRTHRLTLNPRGRTTEISRPVR